MDKAGSTEHTIESISMRVSKLFAEVVQKQRKKVVDVTYGSVKGSDPEITEILAKKLINNKLV